MIALALTVGCAPRERIPTYPNMSANDSLRLMQERSEQITDISGQGAITLTDAKGQSVRLEGAFVFAPPDRARVRAWKFNQAVLDLTVLPDEIFLFLPREDRNAEQLRSASVNAGQAVRDWLALLSRGGVDPGSEAREVGAQLFVATPSRVMVTIDRKTLTARRYAAFDEDGRERFSLRLDQYRTVQEEIVWPMLIEATSPGGRVRIELRDVELNNAPDGAFQPPARAQRLP
jgi:outer membrane lipoprotein-sorting protein